MVPQVHLQKRGGGEKDDADMDVVRRRKRKMVVVRRLRSRGRQWMCEFFMMKIDVIVTAAPDLVKRINPPS